MYVLHCLLYLGSLSKFIATRPPKAFNYDLHQSDYHLVPHRFELVYYDKNLWETMQIRTFKFNRTQPATNFTFRLKYNIIDDLPITVQAFKFMSNEYRIFPIRVAVNACKAFTANILGARNALNCGNCTGCPLIKNRTYHVCNWYPDESKLPPYIPSGDYKLQLNFTYNSVLALVVDGYGKIEPIMKL